MIYEAYPAFALFGIALATAHFSGFIKCAGVSLVFTGIIYSVLAAAAVINEIIAVIASKKGFELAGEIKRK